ARVAPRGVGVALDTAGGRSKGTLRAQPQDHARATLAPILEKEDGRIEWSRPAEEMAGRVRGLLPWPGTVTTAAGGDLKILRARVEAGTSEAPPGTVLAI